MAANRDEFFARPTLAANYWPEHPHILAGRDLEFGGSWLGISLNGRFAAVTNLREVEASGDQSRGDLVKDFLLSQQTSTQFLRDLETKKGQYRPFNLIVNDGKSLCYINNFEPSWTTLPEGIHAIGNIPLSDDNKKTKKGRADMSAAISSAFDHQTLLTMLQDPNPTLDSEEEIYRALSQRFININGYGTRSSSIICKSKNGQWDFWEKSYANSTSQKEALNHFTFSAKPSSSD
ncbi:Uncharacterised protein [Zhongshania aliphaticivorans]|uniref:NRDE family protein n=1 Tax=Zhongshania aliphaticivorans TaxID=1470434 RepID=A0A5S9MS01_9GAMM|nr:Uncharacterised protein [Zhongshania aliphaticivorans]CAA0085943.1 Uncharacterised protein [Zhongshania aliphaticivorans]